MDGLLEDLTINDFIFYKYIVQVYLIRNINEKHTIIDIE